MIQIKDLSKSFGEQLLLDKISFQMNSGERIGLVGRNGHGKSTLFRIILSQEHADSGNIEFPKKYRLGYLEQHLQFNHPTVLEEACSTLSLHEDGYLEDYKAKSILSGLGFSEADFDCSPDDFSGGFQLRIQLAKVLLSEPDCLLLDEPTNYLDITSVRWLESFLRNWPGELMLITHDRAFLNKVCTHTLGIYQKQLRKVQGGPEKLYQVLLEEEEILLKTSANQVKRKAELEAFVTRFKAKATKAKAAQSRQKQLDKMQDVTIASKDATIDFCFTEAAFPGKRMLMGSNLSFSWKEGEELLGGLDLEIRKGDRVAVVGPNGKGKTTLLNVLAKELQARSGELEWSDNLKIGYFGQTNVDRLNPDSTIEEEVGAHLENYSISRARGLAGLMLFEGDAALKKINVLSGGERSRVLLAQILGQSTNLLFLDEPTNHLDMESVESLIEAIDAFSGAVVLVSHSEELLHRLTNKLVVFDGGKSFVYNGSYSEFLQKQGWSQEQKETPAATNTKNRKEDRQARAQRNQERNKAIRPLKKQSDSLEKSLEELGEKEQSLQDSLITASSTGDSQQIQTDGIALQKVQDQIEEAFLQLEELQDKIDQIEKEFEE